MDALLADEAFRSDERARYKDVKKRMGAPVSDEEGDDWIAVEDGA